MHKRAKTKRLAKYPPGIYPAGVPLSERVAECWGLDGLRMHYACQPEVGVLRNGLHSTLLMVHGNPTWSIHWRSLIDAAKAKYQCIAPDHLGCGYSDNPGRFLQLADHIDNLVALVTRLDLQHVTLVAQDWGGAIGLGAMLRMPERLERVVLFNTGAFPPPYIPWRIRACRIPLLGRLAVQGGGLFNRAALRMTLARRRRLDPGVAAAYMAPYKSWSNRRAVFGFVKDIPGGPEHSTWQVLEGIERRLSTLGNRPILLVWGMRDWCFRPDCLERFERIWPQAEVHRLADVGHWVMEDAPEEAVPLVMRFLEQTDRRASELQAVAEAQGADDA
jgi:cis-3-alkyl-4-acyloxetan-2-one decarboxylase